ncbi:hypothetical protein ONZ43_g826 [Nemania bipapillata]|uniref:Uncharacterized protein n=1 Tax=Nemania bipapillata TaxID=110536 RepID=A0ACC2J6R0_9PEZI|nr:hypothetical protein ONZ43_g826 [Nemania bipapillata]
MANYASDSFGLSLEEAVSKIQQLERDNIQLSHDLEECKDRLFDMLLRENDIPEQQVKDEFIRIFEGIDSWIDDVSGDEDFDFKPDYAKILQRNDRESLFKDLGLEYGCLEISWAVKLDKSRYSKWRGETISALVKTREYENLCDEKTRDFDQDLRRDLEPWIDARKLDGHYRSLHHKVLSPAYKFLRMAGCSGKTYQLRVERIAPGSNPSSHGSWGFKDMATWRMLHSGDVIGSIRYLYPGLVRKGHGDQQDLTLVKPVALAYRQPDLQPQPSTFQAGSRTHSPANYSKKHVQGTSTNPPRTEAKRSGRESHETSNRSSHKAPRTDSPQKRSSQQSPRDQSRSDYDRRKLGSRLLVKFGEVLGMAQPSSRAQVPSPPRNDGGRPSRQPQKAATYDAHFPSPDPDRGPEAENREAQRRSGKRERSHSYDDRMAIRPDVAMAEPSQGAQYYGGERISKEYQYELTEQWEPEDGTYTTRPRFDSSG